MTTILILEDERTIADMMRSILEEEGYQVALAYNGRDGLALLDQVRPDLIVCDVMMPVLDGPGFCRQMRADPAYRAIPVVCVSAATEVIAGERASYAAVVRKPFDLDVLLDTIQRVLAATSTQQRERSSP